jgi:multiple sugar transport system permease protein
LRNSGGYRAAPKKFLAYFVLILFSIIFMFPFLWMLSTSLKQGQLVFTYPPQLIPNPVRFQNYLDAIEQFPFFRYLWNTFYITFLITVGSILTSALAGYAFARIPFAFRNQLFILVLAVMMIPVQAIMIPIYLLIRDLGWLDSHLLLIIPSLVFPFGIFLMRQFYLGLPKSLEEAAAIDGCNPLRTFVSIFMPLSKPAIATLCVFSIMGAWNSFMWPLILITTKSKQVLTVGLLEFQHMYGAQYNLLMAATLLVLLPILLAYLFAQRYFVEGIATTGIK